MENQVPKRIYDAAIAVIGSVMIDPSVSGDVFAALRPSDFLAPTYRTTSTGRSSWTSWS